MKLLFQGVNGKERVIAEVDSEEEAMDKIRDFCKERNFTIWYTRAWERDGRRIIDVSSHSEFFILDKD